MNEKTPWVETANQAVRGLLTLLMGVAFCYGFLFTDRISGEVFTNIFGIIMTFWFVQRGAEASIKAIAQGASGTGSGSGNANGGTKVSIPADQSVEIKSPSPDASKAPLASVPSPSDLRPGERVVFTQNRGDWNSEKPYHAHDVVRFGTQQWMAAADNQGVPPSLVAKEWQPWQGQ